MYEYQDDDIIGVSTPSAKEYFCLENTIGTAGCTKKNQGSILMAGKNHTEVMGKWLNGKKLPTDSKEEPIKEGAAAGMLKSVTTFPVKSTGYYCLRVINPSGGDIKVQLDFQNPYGSLPAEYLPLYELSLVFLLVYLVMVVIFGVLMYQHRNVIMQHQHYVFASLFLSMMEMACTFLFYKEFNLTGISSSAILILVALVAAVRGTIALFLLLIVSMGYGVVIPSLGEKSRKIYGLAAIHLFCSLLNIIIGLTVPRDTSIALVFGTLPVSITFSVFICWTLLSLAQTKQSLHLRKQNVKLKMYEKLTWTLSSFFIAAFLCSLGSFIVIIGHTTTVKWYAANWHSLWFLTDGWQVFLCWAATSSIAYIFRPRALNRSYDINEIAIEPTDEEMGSTRNVLGKSLKNTTLNTNLGNETGNTTNFSSPFPYSNSNYKSFENSQSDIGSSKWATENLAPPLNSDEE